MMHLSVVKSYMNYGLEIVVPYLKKLGFVSRR